MNKKVESFNRIFPDLRKLAERLELLAYVLFLITHTFLVTTQTFDELTSIIHMEDFSDQLPSIVASILRSKPSLRLRKS